MSQKVLYEDISNSLRDDANGCFVPLMVDFMYRQNVTDQLKFDAAAEAIVRHFARNFFARCVVADEDRTPVQLVVVSDTRHPDFQWAIETFAQALVQSKRCLALVSKCMNTGSPWSEVTDKTTTAAMEMLRYRKYSKCRIQQLRAVFREVVTKIGSDVYQVDA